MINSVVLVGNLGRDPETRYTPSGTAVTNFSMAVNEVRGSEEKTEYTHWFRVVCFGKLAEVVAEYLAKGRQVAVQGSLRENRWKAEDGTNRSRVEIMARSVQFLGARPEAEKEKPDTGTLRDDPPF